MTQNDYLANHSIGIREALLRFFSAFRLFGFGVRPDCNREARSSAESAVRPSDQCECGGYNEAFVMQHWANYDPTR